MAGIAGTILMFYLRRQNKQLARIEDDDAPLQDKDLRKLQKTADLEGIDITAARALQKGYRYFAVRFFSSGYGADVDADS